MKGGSRYVPNELSFFAVLYKDSLNIYASREEGLSNAVDSLDMNYIPPIPDNDNFQGGIRDFGKFDEGYCFKINSKIPLERFVPTAEKPEPESAKSQVWVICTEEEKEKTILMNMMINLKLKIQHSQGIYMEAVAGEKKPTQKGKSENFHAMEKGVNNTALFGPDSVNSTNDGYWVLLQDWTKCTLKCGGGLSYQHLMCVPPRAGGKPCVGEAVRTKPCNTMPCPQPQTIKKISKNIRSTTQQDASGNNTLAPIVKMMAVSKRPQRFEKCVVKESDVMMEKDDETTKEMTVKPRVPVRLILNDRTVSAYLDDTLNNRVATFVLKETEFVRIIGEKRCFKLSTNTKSSTFCQLESSSGDFLEEWDYDFNLFKHQCKKKRAKSDVPMPEEEKLEKEFASRVDDIKSQMVLEIAEQNKMNVEQNEEAQITKKVQDVQGTSMMALQKETKLEDIIEQEEEAKEENETRVLEAEIAEEKKKEECLNKSIEEKKLENQMNLAKSHAEESIKNIQQSTNRSIAIKRQGIKKIIAQMKKKQDRKRSQLRAEIMTIRTKIADKLKVLNKNGNADLCKATDRKEEYCDRNFADNYVKHQDCMSDSFCYVCCETEFGDFHVLERDRCYASCDAAKPVN